MDQQRKKSRVSMMVLRDEKEPSMIKPQGSSRSRMKLRKQSYGYSGIPGIKVSGRVSQVSIPTPVKIAVCGILRVRVSSRVFQVAIEFKRPVLIYLNTYQLDPHVRFHPENVLKVANELLDEMFTDHKYNAQESPMLAMRIAGELMKQVKAMEFNRYRIISVVTLAQKRAQSYNNAITFLWDHERDGYINVQREVNTAFIQIVHLSTLYIGYLTLSYDNRSAVKMKMLPKVKDNVTYNLPQYMDCFTQK